MYIFVSFFNTLFTVLRKIKIHLFFPFAGHGNQSSNRSFCWQEFGGSSPASGGSEATSRGYRICWHCFCSWTWWSASLCSQSYTESQVISSVLPLKCIFMRRRCRGNCVFSRFSTKKSSTDFGLTFTNKHATLIVIGFIISEFQKYSSHVFKFLSRVKAITKCEYLKSSLYFPKNMIRINDLFLSVSMK